MGTRRPDVRVQQRRVRGVKLAEQHIKYRLSASKLSLFQECPKCFWLAENKKLKRPSTPFPSLPNGIDRVLKLQHDKNRKNEKNPVKQQLIDIWRNWRKLYFIDKKLKLQFYGALDDAKIVNGKYMITDFKTKGSSKTEIAKDYYTFQMSCYSLLLEKNGYKTLDYAQLQVYAPESIDEKGKVQFIVKTENIPISKESALEVIKNAVKVLESKCPEPSTDCGFCKYLTERNERVDLV